MKTKRFDIGRQYQGSIGAPAITEQPGGRYVLASDYDALVEQLESVGAGGVSLMGAQQDAEKVDAQPSDYGRVGEMTPQRAAYFLERFKRDEKLLGPNEQWALEYSIALLQAQPFPSMAGDAALLDMLETLCNGLEWNIENHPEVMNESDAEALAQARALLKRVQPASALDNLQHCPKCLVVFPVQTNIITKAGRAILEASAHLAEPRNSHIDPARDDEEQPWL